MDEREAYDAAERLVQEAHRRAEQAAQQAAQDVPPNGWASPGGTAAPDLHALFALLDTLKGPVPPKLARQLADALRDLLLAIRAILDYSLERLDTSRPDEPQVEDIPIQ